MCMHMIYLFVRIRIHTKSLRWHADPYSSERQYKHDKKKSGEPVGIPFWSRLPSGCPPTRNGTNKRVNSERVTTGMAREQNILRKKVELGHPSLLRGARGFETSWPASPRFENCFFWCYLRRYNWASWVPAIYWGFYSRSIDAGVLSWYVWTV